MVRSLVVSVSLLALLISAVLVSLGFSDTDEGAVRTSLAVAELLGARADPRYARAMEPRPFSFPEDYGAHPDFQTEWWYLTGNLQGSNGDSFGFQFTLFRSALKPPAGDSSGGSPKPSSAWRADQVYMAHLALTDVEGEGFHASERFARGAQGLAGVTTSPFRGWLGDWSLSGPKEGRESGEIFPLTLHAKEGEMGLSLSMKPLKPMVLQGDRGLSRKGPEAGNASFYYSFTRMEAAGELFLGMDTVTVQGLAWMDREWSTSVLAPGQVGWDWFALQLDDGTDLMYYQLRMEDGSPDPLSKGVLVGSGGDVLSLDPSAVTLAVLDLWESPLDGAKYPARWLLSVPGEDLALTLSPLLPNQELDLTVRYWEGAVAVSGRRGEREVQGRGYVELTGYSDTPLSRRGEMPSRHPSLR